MKAVTRASGRILDTLTKDLDVGEARRVDNAPGAFMAVHVERIGSTVLGPVYSIAHYYESNGDLVCDPDIVLLHGKCGRWYPLAYQDSFGYRRAAEIGADGAVMVNQAQQRDLASFCSMWTRNIEAQQGL